MCAMALRGRGEADARPNASLRVPPPELFEMEKSNE